MITTVSGAADELIKLLNKYGWRRGVLGDRQGGFCVLGGIVYNCNTAGIVTQTASNDLVRAIKAANGNRMLTFWNDHEVADVEEILAVVRVVRDQHAAIGG